MGWVVPPLHVRVCYWLQTAWASGAPLLLLMLPRGHAKSTIIEVFNAWLFYLDRQFRILHQSESDGTALKTSRGTQNVLRHHPLCAGMLPPGQGTVEAWWVTGALDVRNASMYAKGITSNVTSSRADLIENDDVEVPRNIANPEAREKLRYRLGEQIHIAVPGARKLFIGTPHTHDSLYEDVKRLGADAMVVRMFEQEKRIENADRQRYAVGFVPEYVFSGLGDTALVLVEGRDYRVEGTTLIMTNPVGGLLDCYASAAWPERFTRGEMEQRRRECRTLNEWDSQYQLHAKPVTQIRLDPARIIPYDVQPVFKHANGATSMWLGRQQIIACAARWDPAGGKVKSDVSSFAVSLQDGNGRRYLHQVGALTGELAEFAQDGKTIEGGQVLQLCQAIAKLQLPRVTVETNGIGGFAPVVLRAALRQQKVACAVVESASTLNKNKRILGSMEPLLLSRGMLWGHADVLRGPLWNQMRDWNPAVADQADDYLDAVAAAIAENPERFRGNSGISSPQARDDWRQGTSTVEVEFER